MIKSIIVVIICLFFCLFIFINLRYFVDITEEPIQSDIIVSLGDDEDGCRLNTAISLYKHGYSKSKKLTYTGRDTISKAVTPSCSKKKYLLNNDIENNDIIHIDKSIISNTMEEVFFIKKYMLIHNYKSVIFVSHPQHSKRISILAKYVADYEESGLKLVVVSCNPQLWNKTSYFTNESSFKVWYTTYPLYKIYKKNKK